MSSDHIAKKHKPNATSATTSTSTNTTSHTDTMQNNGHTNGHSNGNGASHPPVDHTTTAQPTNTPDIDEGLYSRQLYVFGHDAQLKLQKSNVCVVGIDGLGVEIAKNLILAGVGSVGLYDTQQPHIRDLAANFYIHESDVGSKQTRAQLCLEQLRSLNNYVNTYIIDAQQLDANTLRKHNINCVVQANQPLNDTLTLNTAVHNTIKVVAATARGLYGSVFVDNGDAHTVVDVDGEPIKRGLISHVTNAANGIVTCSDDTRHGLSTGDCVVFEEVQGMTELNSATAHSINVLSPYSFQIGDTTGYHPYTVNGGYFVQVKQPVTQSYKPLSETLHKPVIVDDWFGTSTSLHVLHLTLADFQQQNKRLPVAADDSDVQAVQSAAQAIVKQHGYTGVDVELVGRVARGSSAVLSPVAAVIGGIAAQEALKSVTGKFNPIQQFYYFDSSAALPPKMYPSTEYALANTRYDDYISVFGRTVIDKLRASKYFIVGAGAIGCEMIKNMVLMGVGTAGNGQIIITDGDTIEKSNLNRQFLFRPADVGQLKSLTAAQKARTMNAQCNIHSSELRVEPATEHTYDDAFFESLSGVCNALDNVEARLYMDSRCVYYQLPLLDSGTLGQKGSTQVVVPYLTESYGSSRDPPDESIPICTLRNFPNKIEHTIQWARDMFEGLYKQIPDDVNAYVTDAQTYTTELAKQPNVQVEKLRTITAALTDRPTTYEECIRHARLQFEAEFNHAIQQLLYNFPVDHLTTEGLPFWSGPKRPPRPLAFDPNDSLCVSYVTYASRLRAYMFNIPVEQSQQAAQYVAKVAAAVNVPPFKAEVKRIAATDAEAKQIEQQQQAELDTDAIVGKLMTQLDTVQNRSQLRPATFEKDDDSNGHIDYVAAVANLRARNYSIKEADRHTIKGIAGKIIPAIATTTAIVTGLVCLELYKLQQNAVLEQYRNYSINLALPLVQAAEPIPPQYTTVQLKTGELKWSLWNRIDVDVQKHLNGDHTLNALIQYFTDILGLEVNMLSYGASLLYSNFTAPKRIKERLATPISELVQTIGKHEVRDDERYLILEPSVTNVETDEDVEIPYVRYKFR